MAVGLERDEVLQILKSIADKCWVLYVIFWGRLSQQIKGQQIKGEVM